MPWALMDPSFRWGDGEGWLLLALLALPSSSHHPLEPRIAFQWREHRIELHPARRDRCWVFPKLCECVKSVIQPTGGEVDPHHLELVVRQ